MRVRARCACSGIELQCAGRFKDEATSVTTVSGMTKLSMA
jgi:hypothetical protein